MHIMLTTSCPADRRGATAILILVLTSILFIAVVFSIDIARIQLAQLELQSAADLAARAGAEAMSRGVGEPDDLAASDTLIRDEIDMVAQLNSVASHPLVLDRTADIMFGQANQNPADQTYEFDSSTTGHLDSFSNGVAVNANLTAFPVVFGGFVSRADVGLGESATAMISERDICIVLDRSASMLTFDAGIVDVSQYDSGLMLLEDDLYNSGDSYYPDTEFRLSGTTLELSRIQALKLAVLRFREEIDNSRGHEQLGLTTYSDVADDPSGGFIATSPIRLEDGSLDPLESSTLIGSGVSSGSEVYASALESHDSGYINFDMNFMGMRRKGSTNIVAGIEKGVEILYGPGRRFAATPILILMTDGVHNQPGDPLLTATNVKAAHPELLIYTVSFGAGADQTLMTSIADVGGGTHHHASDVVQLIGVFRDLANTAGVMLIK